MLTLDSCHLLMPPSSGGQDIPSSWRVWGTLGTEFPPTGLRPHPQEDTSSPLAGTNLGTSGTCNRPQACFYVLPEALGHPHKSKPHTSSRHPIPRLHFNESRGNTFPKEILIPAYLHPHLSWSKGFAWVQAMMEKCPQRMRLACSEL